MDINLLTLMKLGEKVDIEVAGESYRSRVQDVTDETTLEVDRPIHRGAYLPLRPGQVVKLDYYRPESLYSFDAEILKLYRVEGIEMVTMLATSEIYRHQRRNWYRLTITMPIHVKVLGAAFLGGARYSTRYEEADLDTECLDISVGGMLFLLPRSLPMGTRLQISFTLPRDKALMTLNAMVVRCVWPSEEKLPYRICIAFLDTSNKVQGKLEKFIIEQQKKLLAKK